jgi:Zn-dependent protease
MNSRPSRANHALPGQLANEGGNLYRTDMPDLSPEFLAYAFISYIVFLFSTTCHEAAHALVAKLGGDSTAALGGQVTLNPLPHIRREPWGMVVIPILAVLFMHGRMIGWASAPFDPQWERRHPRRAALMALAGPATNFTLMLVAAAALRLGIAMQWLHWNQGERPDFAIVTLLVLFSLNLLLGTFNLLPVPPLDGSAGIMLFMGEGTAQRYLDWLRGSSYAQLGLLLGLLTFRYFYGPIETFATNLLLRSHF